MPSLTATRSHHLPQLRSRRLAAGLKQTELAELAGCQQSTVSLLEKQQRKARMPAIRKLASALDLTPEDLIGASP